MSASHILSVHTGSEDVAEAQQQFAAFREATGLGIRLCHPGLAGASRPLVHANNPFCGLLADKNSDANPCADWNPPHRDCRARHTPLVGQCGAGLIHVIVPVIRDGVHLARLEGGQVFSHAPTESGFQTVLQRFPGCCRPGDLSKLRTAYFQTPVRSARQLEAAISLFAMVTRSLSIGLLRQLAAEGTPCANRLEGARLFIDAHLGEPITMRQVARQVKLCPAYFCRLFKKEGGRRFGTYLAQARVERAQRLLWCSSNSITEIGYAAGFQSLCHFNHLFKRYTGLTPTQYRNRRTPPDGLRPCELHPAQASEHLARFDGGDRE